MMHLNAPRVAAEAGVQCTQRGTNVFSSRGECDAGGLNENVTSARAARSTAQAMVSQQVGVEQQAGGPRGSIASCSSAEPLLRFTVEPYTQEQAGPEKVEASR